MRKLLPIIFVLLSYSPAFGADYIQLARMTPVMAAGVSASAESTPATYVQGAGKSGDGASFTTDSMTVTSGNLLVFVVAMYNTAVNDGWISDSRGNTWQRDYLLTGTSELAIYSCIAKDSGALTVTVNPGSTSKSYAIGLVEFSNIATSSWNGGASGAVYDNTSTNIHTGDITFANNGACVGFLTHNGASTTIAPDAGWEQIAENESTESLKYNLVYDIVSSGTINIGWTTGTQFRDVSVGGACYKQK